MLSLPLCIRVKFSIRLRGKNERRKDGKKGGMGREKKEERKGRGGQGSLAGNLSRFYGKEILLYKTVQTIFLLKIKGNSALIFLFNKCIL